MNPWQFAQQIKFILERATWDGSGGQLMFGGTGSVAVFAGMPTSEQVPIAYPWALVGIDSGTFDPDHPDVLTQNFTLTIGALVAGDRMGEHAIIGGPASTLQKSGNRGVAEVSARARSYVQALTGADGCRVQLSGVTTSPPTAVDGARHLAMEQTTLSAVCTAQPFYDHPQRLRYSGGQWKWAGDHCAARFDFLQFRLVRKAGTSAPASPSDGTTIYTGTAQGWTGASTAGNAYAVFADYNARGGATVEASSATVVGSSRVV